MPTLPAPLRALHALVADRILFTAIVVSVGLHITVLAVRFVDPDFMRVKATDPPLEIILVNARSASAPGAPEALAQVNLDGGGANDSGRRTSPLPNLMQVHDGDSLDSAQRRMQQLEREQSTLLTALQSGLVERARVHEARPAEDAASGFNEHETREQLARVQAEIAREISDYQKRPRRHHFMPSTSEYRYARYVEDWRAQVERIGNEHYPDEARGKVYGTLRMTVAIRRDGTLADATIEQSSGSPLLDRAARRIVKLAQPYPPFPPEIARDTDILEITRTWIFTNDQLATRSALPAKP